MSGKSPENTIEVDLSILRGRCVAVSTYSAWSILNYRLGLVRRLLSLGVKVVVISPPDDSVPAVTALGCIHVPMSLQTTGRNPFNDLASIPTYLRAFKEHQPEVLLNYTIKPVIYGTIAARLSRVDVINTITGIGQTFDQKPHVLFIIKSLYRLSQRYARWVFFQNKDQRDFFLSMRLLKPDQARLVSGSGVDLEKFQWSAPRSERPFVFLLLARMLRPKGVYEFVEAARELRQQGINARFVLAGEHKPERDIAVDRADLNRWVNEGLVEYRGMVEDVPALLQSVDCAVLPSYTEGTPRSLLEALAAGRPIIASDVEGCREVVQDGVNGLFCKVRDSRDLARQMARVVGMSGEELLTMSRAGRAFVEARFDERKVVEVYIQAIGRIVMERDSKVRVNRG